MVWDVGKPPRCCKMIKASKMLTTPSQFTSPEPWPIAGQPSGGVGDIPEIYCRIRIASVTSTTPSQLTSPAARVHSMTYPSRSSFPFLSFQTGSLQLLNWATFSSPPELLGSPPFQLLKTIGCPVTHFQPPAGSDDPEGWNAPIHGSVLHKPEPSIMLKTKLFSPAEVRATRYPPLASAAFFAWFQLIPLGTQTPR